MLRYRRLAQVPLLEKVLGRFYRVMDGLGHPCSFGLFRSSPCFHFNSTVFLWVIIPLNYVYMIIYVYIYIHISLLMAVITSVYLNNKHEFILMVSRG